MNYFLFHILLGYPWQLRGYETRKSCAVFFSVSLSFSDHFSGLLGGLKKIIEDNWV